MGDKIRILWLILAAFSAGHAIFTQKLARLGAFQLSTMEYGCTAELLNDDVVPDSWLVVTSLVQRDELEAVFPTELSTTWVLEGLETMPLRQALCNLQGLIHC